MTYVYNLCFRREYDDREDTELQIGIFATRADAEAAIDRLNEKPGFRDFVEGFEVEKAKLNDFGWEEGFISVVGLPPKDANASVTDVPAYLEDYLPGGPKYDGLHLNASRKRS